MLIGAAYAISERASAKCDPAAACAGICRNNVEASASAINPDAAVPTIAATSGEASLKPTASASRNARVVAMGSVIPREKMSCCITFIPRDRGTDAIQSQTWHRAENQCKRRNHLRLHVKTVVKKPERQYHNASSDDRLHNSQDNSDSKKRPASRAVTHSF